MKYLLELSYLGEKYCGFQVQDNAETVQGVLCRAGRALFGVDCLVTGCSRTDSGVHAIQYFATISHDGGADIPPDKLPRAINTFLPADISVHAAENVDDEFSVRRAVFGKEYMYLVHNAQTGDPFLAGRAYEYARVLDVDLMNAAAEKIKGRHDFACFMAAGSDISDTARTINDIRVERDGENVMIFVSADGFLYNMVRIIAGTLIEVSEGKITPDSIPNIINSKNRANAGRTAPACGLYLKRVFINKNYATR